MKLSIGMMVKNEEKYLEKCLNALKPILSELDSELIIVDTGSTDSTVEIARKYTKKVYFHSWEADFSKMRNIVLSYITGEWFLFIDADEIIIKSDYFIKQFKSNKIYYDIGLIEFNNIIDINSPEKKSVINLPRLFKNNKNLKFHGKIHEQIPLVGTIGLTGLVINHYGYVIIDKELMDRKFLRNKDLLEKMLVSDPNNIYLLEQLSTTYGMFQNYEKADYYIKKAYALIKPNSKERFIYAYVYDGIVKTMLYYKNYEEAERLALEGLQVIDWHVDLAYFLSVIYYETARYSKCIEYVNKFLDLRVRFSENSVKNISIISHTIPNVEIANKHKAISFFYLDKFDEALRIFQSLDLNNLDFSSIIPFYISTILNEEKYELLKEMYRSVKKSDWNRNKFLRDIESEKIKRKKDFRFVYSIEKEFSEEVVNSLSTDPYSKLNNLRIFISTVSDEKPIQDTFAFFEKFDFSEAEDYFGDVLYFNILYQIPLLSSFENISNKRLKNFFRYMYLKYENTSLIFLNYLEKNIEKPEDTKHLRLMIELTKWTILDDEIEISIKNIADERYVAYVNNFVRSHYSHHFIENPKLELCRSSEEKFHILISKSLIEVDLKLKLTCLKKALYEYPILKEVINYLMKDIEKRNTNSLEKKKINKTDDICEGTSMEKIKISKIQNYDLSIYKEKIKNNIKVLLEEGQLDSAKKIINEIEELLNLDADFYSIKGIIAMMEEKLDVAKAHFIKGLELDKSHKDILYNLAKVYALTGCEEDAISMYKWILGQNISSELRLETQEALELLGVDSFELNTLPVKMFNSTKLHVGCGRNIMDGWINLDLVALPGVDIVFDLDKSQTNPLPLEGNTIDEFYVSHVIEHINNPLPMMEELYRVALPNAKAVFRCPYGSSDEAFEDPTHVKQYFLNSFGYFSQPYYWRADYGYRGDWLTEKIILIVDGIKYKNKNGKKILEDVNLYRNIVKEMIVELKAIKPIRESKRELQNAPKIEIVFE